MPEPSISEDNKNAIDILLKEYEHRFAEIMLHSQRYQKQADFLNLFLTSVVAVAALIFSGKTTEWLKSYEILQGSEAWILYCGFLFFGSLFLFHIFSSILDALFLIHINGASLGALEVKINHLSGSDLLTWEHQTVPHFFGPKQIYIGRGLKPNVLAGAWMVLIFILLCAAFCGMSLIFIQPIAYIYTPLVLFLMFFHLLQWRSLLTSGFRAIDSHFNLEILSAQPEAYRTMTEYLAAAAPVFAVLVMAVWSLQNGALWWSSPYIFPLASIPSIYIGDFLILPILNLKIARWFRIHMKELSKRRLTIYISVSLLSAVVINAYLHYQWIHDPFTGFTDTSFGKMTPAGWCHFIFSTGEMTYVFFFLLAWLETVTKNRARVVDGQSICLTLFFFSSISIIDAIMKYFYVFPCHNIQSTPRPADLLVLTPFVVSGILYALVRAFSSSLCHSQE